MRGKWGRVARGRCGGSGRGTAGGTARDLDNGKVYVPKGGLEQGELKSVKERETAGREKRVVGLKWGY